MAGRSDWKTTRPRQARAVAASVSTPSARAMRSVYSRRAEEPMTPHSTLPVAIPTRPPSPSASSRRTMPSPARTARLGS